MSVHGFGANNIRAVGVFDIGLRGINVCKMDVHCAGMPGMDMPGLGVPGKGVIKEDSFSVKFFKF
jgi:hypothetical protein